MKSYILIPARLASERLPGKLLLKETGMTVIEHTYRQAEQVPDAEVAVVTGDPEITAAVLGFWGNVIESPPDKDFRNGTERIAEVATRLNGLATDDNAIIVNLQADEPEINPYHIARLISYSEQRPQQAFLQVATLVTSCQTAEEVADPSTVKVVLTARDYALYFSRHPIPYFARKEDFHPREYYRHIGVYAFRANTLYVLRSLPPERLEGYESLEQLRWLENGIPIKAVYTGQSPPGINTRQDYDEFVKRYKERLG